MSRDFADSVFAHTGTRVRGVSSRRVGLGLLMLAVLPLLLVMGVAWYVQRGNLDESAGHDMAAWADLHAAAQEQVLLGTRQVLLSISQSPPVMSGDWPACNGYMQRLAASMPRYVSLGVVSLEGLLVCRSTASSDRISLADRPYFKAVLAGAPFAMGEYTVGRVTGSKNLPFAHAVRDAQGTLVAVAFLGMDLGLLAERLRAVPMPTGVTAVMSDAAGAVLASTQGGAVAGVMALDPSLAQALARGASGPLRTRGADGRDWLHHVSPVPAGNGRLQVAVSAPVDALVRPQVRQLAGLMAALLALLAVYALLIWRLGRRWLLRPLEQLGRAMRLIEMGAYMGPEQGVRSRVREIRQLQRGLTAMWAGLARRARQRDAALAASDAARAGLQAVLNEMDDGFLVLNRDWTINFCNRRAAELVLRDLQDMEGLDFWTLFPDEGMQASRQAAEREVALDHPFAFEEHHAHYGRWFEVRVFAAGDGIGVFLRDSTPHWEMIDELRERERRYRELFEANPNVMWIFDTESFAFLAVNAAAVRRYGYSESEFLAMTAPDIHPPDDRDEFVQAVQHDGADRTLKDQPTIWRHLTRSGELMLVDIVHHNISFEGRPARLVMAADVTTRLSAESRLRRQLEQLQVQHDESLAALQASRQVLGGYLHMISAEVLPTLRRTQAADAGAPAELDRLRRKAGRVEQLLQEAVRLTQIGRAPFEPALTDLSAMATDLIKVMRRAEPGRRVHVEIEPELLCRCDPALALILIQALLDNAWKFTAREPSAWIRMGREPSQSGPGQVPQFFVSDNGVGFDAGGEERLYKPFVRLHSGAEFPGWGLGLATARAVVTRHGGDIHARSQPGQGATFVFSLEARPRPAGALVSEVVIESLPSWDD